jgi:hypothetical protein
MLTCGCDMKVACLIVWLGRKTLTTPAVPSAVAYRHVRRQQWRGSKLSKQCNPTRRVQSALRGVFCPASAKVGEVLGLVA